MPKAYWIARVDIKNAERYPDYVSTARPAFERFGAKFIVRGGAATPLEGHTRARNVVIEFASLDDALACYNSPEYQAAVKIRQAAAESDLVIVEGYEPA